MDRMEELRRLRGAGEYRAAMDLAQALLTVPEQLTAAERFEAARLGAGAALSAGELFRTREFAEIELAEAEAMADPILIGTARFHCGSAEMWLSNTQTALEQFAAYQLCDTPERPELERYRGAAWFNMGTVHMQRRDYAQAIHCLHRAREIHEVRGDAFRMIESLLQEAWAWLSWGHPESAGHRLEQAITLMVEHPDPSLQNTCMVHRALYHQRLGEYDRARSLCEEILTPGRERVTAHHRSEAAWIAGECALSLGLLEVAWQFSQLATAEALTAKWPALMNRAGELRQRLLTAGYHPPEST